METYYRMVIDLYKDAFTDLKEGKDPDKGRILNVKKAIACAVTEAKIKNEPHDYLLALQNDLRAL